MGEIINVDFGTNQSASQEVALLATGIEEIIIPELKNATDDSAPADIESYRYFAGLLADAKSRPGDKT